MRNPFRFVRQLLLVAAVALSLAMPAAPLLAARSEAPAPPAPSSIVPGPAQVTDEVTLTGTKLPASVIEPALLQMEAAAISGDTKAFAAYAGDRNVNQAAGLVRVILEMAVDPEAHPVGRGRAETVALEDGSTATVETAPPIAIRRELSDAITAQGAQYETAYEDRVQVLSPITSVSNLASIPGVRLIRLPYPATTSDLPGQAGPTAAAPQVGSRTSEGVALTLASSWQSAGHTGVGTNVAVFDFGFSGWQAMQASGDLPGGARLVAKDFSASVYNFSPDTAGLPHGAACAEIVYDMAPGSTVYMYAFWTDVELGNAIDDFRNNVTGKRVATMSVVYANAGPYDGTGPINTMINNAQSSGILWINSTGNNQRSHWSGTAAQYSGGNTVAFGSGNVLGIGPNAGVLWNFYGNNRITFYLEWNDWNAARTGNQNHTDYDLFLLRWTGSAWSQVAASTGNQCRGSTAPVEGISYVVPAGGPYTYGILIQRDTGSGACPNNFGHWLQAHSFLSKGEENLFWYINQCNSLLIPGDGDSALTVGATFWNADSVAPVYGLEPFSSLGPRNAPGGSNPGTTVNKPDVVAPDGVSGVIYGVSNGTTSGDGFFGTSAATPHVAGMAALIWSRYPAFTLANLRAYIADRALYRADGGACGGTYASASNNRYGYGRILLPGPRSSYLPLIIK